MTDADRSAPASALRTATAAQLRFDATEMEAWGRLMLADNPVTQARYFRLAALALAVAEMQERSARDRMDFTFDLGHALNPMVQMVSGTTLPDALAFLLTDSSGRAPSDGTP